MFLTFFITELKYVLKQKMVYIFTAIVALLVFGAVVSDAVIIGGAVGNVHRNAPHVITMFTSIIGIFGLFFAATFQDNAALREHKYHFNEILFSTPLTKSGYFFGRFFSAVLISTLPMLGIFIGVFFGILLGPAFEWITTDQVGPFYFKTLLNNYFIFILPNMFLAGAIIYALANRFRSTIISFVGVMIIIAVYIISGSLMSDIDNQTLSAMLDMFGIRAYSVYSRYFTPDEMNTLNPVFSGVLLWNRLLWVSVGFLILFLSYFTFSFQERKSKATRQNSIEESAEKRKSTFVLPHIHQKFTSSTAWKQFNSFYALNLRSILKSTTFKLLFLFSLIIFFTNIYGGFSYFGLKSYPVTYKMIDQITNTTGLFNYIILIFFSGEMIWHNRENNINEVIDATPHSSMSSLLAKLLALIVAVTLIDILLIIFSVFYQLINGFTQIELSVYIFNFLSGPFISYIVYGCLLLFIQTISKGKYLGYFISIAFLFIFDIITGQIFHIESNMINIGGTPNLKYSDISGFGPGTTGAFWFNIYWLLFGFILLFIASALWNRGTILPLKERIKNSRSQLSKKNKTIFLSLMGSFLVVAGFVYYNTQILNTYKTSKQMELEQVRYEKEYKKYGSIPHPKIVDIEFFIDLFPKERDLYAKSIIQLKNENTRPLDSLVFSYNTDWESRFEIPNSKIVFEDKEMGFIIFQLKTPLLPNEEISITFHNNYLTKGFENSEGNTSILENGTFINNGDILPQFGYISDYEVADRNKRKKHGLPPKDRMPELQANCNEACMSNYLSGGVSDFIPAKTIISTSSDQIAIAPGSLTKQWTENNRNYYEYILDHPSQNFYSFISARYKVAKRKWKDVDIEVYYDKKHEVNIEMMLDAVERSLIYYTKNFGPYYHKQCRIIEFPRYATFAQAFPGTMPYSESFGFIADLRDTTKNNVVDAVIAHEMAHQWWAHQVIGAKMQGSTMLSESFAEYSSLMTMKQLTTQPMKMREFLKYDLDRYLNGRSSETEKELPLYKVENQMHIHYGKGSVILYALQDYIGEDRVNSALRNFLEEFRYKNPPYPTSLNFLAHLEKEVPDSMQYLITDWFKEITLYDLRMEDAIYSQKANGKYEVKVTVKADKLKADSLGKEKSVGINDWIDIGFFADNDEKELQFQQRVKINQPEMTFAFELDKLPKRAAIDPRWLLIDRVLTDNSKRVEKATLK